MRQTAHKRSGFFYFGGFMNNIPIPADLEADDLITLTESQNGALAVADRLQVSVEKLNRLITTSPDAIDMIRAVQAEMEAWGRLRMAMMVPKAMDTIEQLMRGDIDQGVATAAEKAAEAVFDRSYLPRQSARLIQEKPNTAQSKHVLPTLDQLITMAETDGEAFELMKRHRQLVKEMEALRHGAREIIDVRAEEKT